MKTVDDIKKDGITDEMLMQYVEFYETVDSDNLTDTVCWILAKESLALRDRTRWIPVSERLPDDDIECLVCDECGIYMAIVNEGDWWMDGRKLEGITHWMELPELPEVER